MMNDINGLEDEGWFECASCGSLIYGMQKHCSSCGVYLSYDDVVELDFQF